MRITKIVIGNYKSIKRLEIPMPTPEEYGGSSTVFLLGVNESGKSNILEAIHRIGTSFDDGAKFDELCHKSAHEDDEPYADIFAYAQLSEKEQSYYQNLIAHKFPALKNDAKKIVTDEVIKNVFCGKDNRWGSAFTTSVNLNSDIALEKYAKIGESIILTDSVDEASGESVEPLTIEDMQSLIPEQCEDELNAIFPTVRFWKPSREHLITAPIDLSEYQAGSIASAPLNHIFCLYGKRDKDSRNSAIEMALANDEKKSELQDKLSKVTTRHINSVWKEHRVNIKIKIDGSLLKVHVEDVDTEHAYYNMTQRSDGFKNFISLLLSLSAQYEGKILNNNILLLDEPEASMHPGGVRRMRDEILKMGRSNQIFVATHSPSMVDLNTPQRHGIVKKSKMNTSVHFVSERTSMKDEEVMRMAFGIDVVKELLPNNLLLVEGQIDKELLQFAFYELNKDEEEFISTPPIKSMEGGNAHSLATLLDFQGINAVILLDGDKEGKKMQKKIIDNQTYFDESNVFTLPDLVDGLPNGATIEDLLPVSCIEKTLKDSGKKYNLDAASNRAPVLSKITALNHELRSSSNPGLAKIKSKIAKRVIQEFPCRNERDSDLLFKLARALLEKLPEAKKA